MYLHYFVEPHFLGEKFEIFHPVGSIKESDQYAKSLMKNQNKMKTYSDFYLTDITQKNIIKPYDLEDISHKKRIIRNKSNGYRY